MSTYHGHGSNVMTVNGLTCGLHMPNARHQEFRRVGEGMEEVEQGLPESALQVVYNVDDYPACPEGWMRGSANSASYFVAVEPEKGMWLDFNRNQSGHSYHVAVLISVQGVNPLTVHRTEGIRLEQYRTSCPVHNEPFEAQRFCRACGYKWNGQNYLASNATPQGYFWLDGFRAADGKVRQYVFTLEAMRGVAAQVIGDARVYAIGVSFFLSKAPKPVSQPTLRFRHDTLGPMKGGGGGYQDDYYRSNTLGSSPMRGAVRTRGSTLEASPQHMEVAAGARIRQQVHDDPESIDFWQDHPAGTIYVNYIDATTRDAILAAGMNTRDNRGEGPLGGLRVGN